jgi:putative peptidoglycan lipid II flippase
MITWIAAPVAVIAFFGRGYVTSFISNIGNNNSNGTIASILGMLCIAIFARSVFHIASRGFYAYQDTKTPFRVSVIAIGLTIALSVAAYFLGWGVDGLGLAQSIGALIEVAILLFILQRRSEGKLLNRDFWKAILRMGIATAVAGCVAFSMVKFVPLTVADSSLVITIPKFILITAVSLIAYVIASYFLNLDEVRPLINMVKKVLFRNVK